MIFFMLDYTNEWSWLHNEDISSPIIGNGNTVNMPSVGDSSNNNWFSNLFRKWFGTGLTDAQKEQNAYASSEADAARLFSSSEAAAQRDWSAAEAERARDWNEEMYAKYNSLSGKIAQAEEAGVNPMLAVTGNAVSPMSTSASAPSGASASGSAASSTPISSAEGLVQLVGTLLGLRKQNAEIALMGAEAKKVNAEALTSEIDNLSRDTLNQVTIASKMADIRASDATTEEKRANISLISEKIKSEILNQSYIESSTGLNHEMAGKVYQEAIKIFNEAESIALDVTFKRDTLESRKLQVEYDRLVGEFKARLKDLAMPEDDMHAVQEFFYKILAILK